MIWFDIIATPSLNFLLLNHFYKCSSVLACCFQSSGKWLNKKFNNYNFWLITLFHRSGQKSFMKSALKSFTPVFIKVMCLSIQVQNRYQSKRMVIAFNNIFQSIQFTLIYKN